MINQKNGWNVRDPRQQTRGLATKSGFLQKTVKCLRAVVDSVLLAMGGFLSALFGTTTVIDDDWIVI
jgi:hypothetical protein